MDQSGCKEGGPVIVPMVGMDDPGAGTAEEAGQSHNLERSKFRKGLEGGSLGGERGGLRAGGFHFPALLDEALSEGEALGVRTASPEPGVQHDHAGGKGGRGHVIRLG